MRPLHALAEQLKRLASGGRRGPEVTDARSEDLAEAIQRLSPEEGAQALARLDPMQAGEIMVEAPTATARAIAKHLPDEALAVYLDLLPMDDAIDLSEELEPERFERLLDLIPQEDAAEILRLMAYPDDSVGRLMTERFFQVSPEMTVAEALADLRQSSEEKYESVNELYVLEEGRLVGLFSLRKALRADLSSTARTLMNADPIVAEALEPGEDAARRMAKYGFYSLPVVDGEGRMVGLFTGDDAQTILREADTEDVLKLGAVSGDADAYLSLSPFQLYRRRTPWLLALFVAETLTGAVMRHYGQGDTGLGIAPIMFFVPLLIGAGGNAGSQVTTTITRALALGEVKLTDAGKVMGREVATALMIGLTLGTLGLLRAYLPEPIGWQSGLPLSLVVGLALPTIVLWASLVGSLLPLGARRLGIDPAVMSAPFITTFVDATGLIIYFEIARRLM